MKHGRLRALAALLGFALLAATAPISITGQLLAYQNGYVFFTTGDGFRLAPDVRILDDATKKPALETPKPRLYARATFDDTGHVVELDLSRKPLPVGPLPDAAEQYAVAASTPFPNPELAPKPASATGGVTETFSGKLVLVTITVQVPADTPFGSEVYITTDTSGWDPKAIAMDRIDALHFRVTRRIASGTILHYLYTRGSLQTEERAENGIDRTPREITLNDADLRAVKDVVYAWADLGIPGGIQAPQPNTIPTPFNPAPFPNLPSGIPTPHPR
ncbi:MAG: hypothetical protein KGN02_08075 [bacterium]|nr:hypothetical protein [bacterium]